MSLEAGLLVVYVVLILLPWVGGLALTVAQYWVMAKRISELQRENAALRKQVSVLYEEKMKLDLNLQQTLIENAMLGIRRDEGKDTDR